MPKGEEQQSISYEALLGSHFLTYQNFNTRGEDSGFNRWFLCVCLHSCQSILLCILLGTSCQSMCERFAHFQEAHAAALLEARYDLRNVSEVLTSSCIQDKMMEKESHSLHYMY